MTGVQTCALPILKMNNFPWGQLQNSFGEVIGGLACARNRDGILSGIINTAGLGGASIYIPPDSEGLYDYKLIIGNTEYLLSSKSAKGVSNQVKPQFVIPYITEYNLTSTTEYRVLQSLADERGRKATIHGPFYAWEILQSNNEITNACIADINSNYTSGSQSDNKISDPAIWQNFVNTHIPSKKSKLNIKNVTYGEIRFQCEQLIESWSKNGTQNRVLKEIFEVFLNKSRVIYIKLDLNKRTGTPTFSASAGGGATIIRNLYLRTSNYSTRTSDRIGFQIS